MKFTVDAKGAVFSSPALAGDVAYVGVSIYARYFGDYQDMVLAFYRVFSVGAIWSSPVVDKGVVYFGSTDGSLYAVH